MFCRLLARLAGKGFAFTEKARVASKAFLVELKSSPDMAGQIVRTLARRLRQTDARLTE